MQISLVQWMYFKYRSKPWSEYETMKKQQRTTGSQVKVRNGEKGSNGEATENQWV